MPPQTADPAPHPAAASATQRREWAEAVRPILRALARMIVTDRRAVVLASPGAEILLANLSAQRLGIGRDQLLSRLDWPGLRAGARRAGSAPVTWQLGDQQFDGELVHVPLGPADSYMLRLAESDQEATWLRNRARSALLMRVAHDLRTPIQSLLTAADGLTRPGDESAAEAGPRIRRAAELALDHIGNVLAVVRGEQSQKGSQPDEDFRIVDELTSLVAMIDPIARARATELQLSVDAPAGLTLFGPLRFVRALCQNLIDNSVHHGGGRIELRLSCAPLAEALPGDETGGELWGIWLELADEGGGLPPAQRARLMRALGLPPDEAGGEPVASGQRPSAGLEVLAHALRQLGGRMTIADRGADGAPLAPGGGGRVIGTLFTVILSLPRAPDQPQAPTAAPAAGNPLAGRSILLVEDGPSNRDWLTHVLQSAGAEVSAVGSGPEALALLSRNEEAGRIDLVLTDVTLPRMSGVELAARLRDGDPAAAIRWRGKVVGLTAHAEERIRTACLEAGMVCVLEKPILPRTLTGALAEILAGAPLRVAEPGPPKPPESVLDAGAVGDLAGQMGLEPTRAFMRRALAEARAIFDELQDECPGPDTARRLHAATGASGLTGLRLVEQRLRGVEAALAEAGPLAAPCAALAEALELTVPAIERFGA